MEEKKQATTLKEKAAKGLLWGGMNNALQQVLNLLFGVWLARLLSPSDYGMVQLLTVFSMIAGLLQESGFTQALTNQKHIRHEDYNAVFWFSTLTGLGMYLILFFCAPLIADFYHEPELVPLSRYVFLGFLIASTGVAHNAYMFRNLKVKQTAVISVISLCLSGITGILLAMNGMAYWGLATQGLVFISCNTLGKWLYSGWMPSFKIDLRPLKGMIGFSSKVLGTNIVQHINNNILTIIMGRFYTKQDVGYYNQANKWNYMGFNTILGMVNGMAQPVLHKAEDSESHQIRVFRKILRFTSFVSFPCLFGLSLTAPQLIVIAVTDKWAASAELMQIICIGGAFLPIQNLYQNLIIARRKSNLTLWNTLIFGIVQITTALICYPFGIRTMIVCYVLINILWLFVWHYWAWRVIRLRLLDTLKDTVPFAGIAAAVMILTHFLTCKIENIYLLLGGKIVIAALLYIVAMKLLHAQIFEESLNYLKAKIKFL